MKKLFFLLLMAVILVGFMPAEDAAGPPGGITIELALSEFGVDSYAVTPDTVLAFISDDVSEIPSLYEVMATDSIMTILPHEDSFIPSTLLRLG
ncbi:MAG: hypothetical protein FWD36_08885 [Treponema sp.]|nr:hypothetical protein [Treponema sp.]